MLNRQRELTLPRPHCHSHCHQLRVCFNTPHSVSQAKVGLDSRANARANGLYAGNFTVFKGGSWLLSVKLKGSGGAAAAAIDGSPFNVSVAAAPVSAGKSTAAGGGVTQFSAGGVGWVQITTRDTLGC